MTNHWSDIANATAVIVWGANPAENHPACIAHVGRARFPQQFFAPSDPRSLKKAAQLIVVDPRKNRTASLCNEDDTTKPAAERDRYIRIRPGTDIALENGLIRYMIEKIEGLAAADPVRVAFFAHLNQNSAGQFYTDGSATAGSTTAAGNTAAALGAGFANGNSKYTDARFLMNAAGTDYMRDKIVAGTGAITAIAADSTTITNFPLKAATVDADPNTVYNRLKLHVAPYTLVVVADIVGCSTDDISFLGDAFIANSKCSNPTNADGTPSVKDARNPSYRVATILYAMGITQHTCGSQNIKGFALLQTLMGNQGRQGGGINALRGIHNVQGSTDMGLLNGNIPAYSGNPATQVTAIPDTTTNAFGKYMDALWGNPLWGRPVTATAGQAGRALMDNSYLDAYNTTAAGAGAMALQQRGFFNMTLKWFGGYANAIAQTDLALRRVIVDAAYSLWPKGNGDDHISMFRNMAPGKTTKAAVVWGQNPAVTEPNQGVVRTGLYNLDLLVCVDLFENETAAVSRKGTGVTFLIPTAAHVEKAGSSTNSGRTLQWRYRAATPAGNSKDDTELLLRLAKALNGAGAFQHIKDVWDNPANGITYTTDPYTELYQLPYGGYTGTGAGFDALVGTGELVNLRKNVDDAVTYNTATNNLTGSEWVAETVFREMCTDTMSGGTIWIYTEAYGVVAGVNNYASRTHTAGGAAIAGGGAAQSPWAVLNRAKSRDRADGNSQLQFPGWGYAWLVNRRVFYNNSDVPGDVADYYMEPDSCSRLFTTSAFTGVTNYSRWYRKYHGLADRPSVVQTPSLTSPHYAGTAVSLAGRFPGHVEPYETPRQDLLPAWGRNTKNTGVWDLVKTDTVVAGRDVAATTYPLVLTTIRCVEHFQGGPITRNNWFNVELEPEPWIEINSFDARAVVPPIVDGDMVRVVTARTETLGGHQLEPYGSGFRARVGVGLQGNQKVGLGVVGIPWHWGEKGLSTGSRANDLTVDAFDANSTIPEYKACLCRIEKI